MKGIIYIIENKWRPYRDSAWLDKDRAMARFDEILRVSIVGVGGEAHSIVKGDNSMLDIICTRTGEVKYKLEVETIQS